MKYITVIIALVLFSLNGFTQDSDEVEIKTPKNELSLKSLLEQVRLDGLKEKELHEVRENEFRGSRDKQKALLSKSKRQLKKTKAVTKALKLNFDKNEESLAQLEEELHKRMGNLGEMYGVVRQVSQDMAAIREHSLLALELGAQSELLNKLADSKALPSITELEGLWYELQLQMTKQGESKRFPGEYIDTKGQRVNEEIAHIGPFVAITSSGYLNYHAHPKQLYELAKQPSEAG